MGLLKHLRELDAYPKLHEEFCKKTRAGGIITLVSSLIMLVLLVSETSECQQPLRCPALGHCLQPMR